MAKVSIDELASKFVTKEAPAVQNNKSFKESFEVTNPASMSGFRGMFGDTKLTKQEEDRIQDILNEHYQSRNSQEVQVDEDRQTLFNLTAEIKAISNQSILLHGERIKKAQKILSNYKDGAFSEWLLFTYGNRQTPYSMLQYYELYHALPTAIRPMIENMPKKAAYILASREGSLDQKLDLIKNYKGQSQNEVIFSIQEKFPITEGDKRKKVSNETTIDQLEKLLFKLEKRRHSLSEFDKIRLSNIASRFAAF
jgi:hypothetical protein